MVQEALGQLNDFLFRDGARDDAVNHTVHTGAVHIFKHLKYHGHSWDPESVREWALAHSWDEADAHALSDIARGIREGVRYHAAPDPFGRHAYDHWLEMSVDHLADDAPDASEGRYWFWSYPCEDYDYLFDASWTTFPGRMAAYCPHRQIAFRQSRYELPPDLPEPTRAWVGGYLAGSLPRPPDRAWNEDGDEQPEVMRRWEAAAMQFRKTGWWPHAEDLDEYYQGRIELTRAPRQFDPDAWWPGSGLGARHKPPPPDR